MPPGHWTGPCWTREPKGGGKLWGARTGGRGWEDDCLCNWTTLTWVHTRPCLRVLLLLLLHVLRGDGKRLHLLEHLRPKPPSLNAPNLNHTIWHRRFKRSARKSAKLYKWIKISRLLEANKATTDKTDKLISMHPPMGPHPPSHLLPGKGVVVGLLLAELGLVVQHGLVPCRQLPLCGVPLLLLPQQVPHHFNLQNTGGTWSVGRREMYSWQASQHECLLLKHDWVLGCRHPDNPKIPIGLMHGVLTWDSKQKKKNTISTTCQITFPIGRPADLSINLVRHTRTHTVFVMIYRNLGENYEEHR